MNDELSHVAQWQTICQQAANFSLKPEVTPEGFTVSRTVWPYTQVGDTYQTLAQLRGAIAADVAKRRAKGERI